MPLYRRRVQFTSTSWSGTSTVSNSISETAFTPTLSVPYTKFLTPGKTFRLTARGVYSSAASGQGSLTLKVKGNGVTLVSNGGPTMTTSAVNRGWQLEVSVTAPPNPSGSVEVQGENRLSTTGSAATFMDLENTGSISLDGAATQLLSLTVQFSSADPGNTITCRQATFEELG